MPWRKVGQSPGRRRSCDACIIVAMRAFIAAFTDTETRQRLAMLAASLTPPGYRLIAPANLHVTLRFLGSIDDADLAQLRTVLINEDLAVPEPCCCQITGICAFPTPRMPRVLAFALDSGGGLVRVAETLNRALEPHFGAPDRAFHAHVTFARLAPRARPLRQIPRLGDTLPAAFDGSGLYRSETRADGAVYSRVLALGPRQPQ